MSETNIEASIKAYREKRQSVASSKNVYGKAHAIAMYLGEVKPKKHGSYLIYASGSLTITYDTWGPNLQIEWEKSRVYSCTLGVVNSYRPDIEGWESLIDVVYNRDAVPKQQAKKTNELNKKIESAKDHWGFQF